MHRKAMGNVKRFHFNSKIEDYANKYFAYSALSGIPHAALGGGQNE